MGEYDRAIATARRLIAKKGQLVIWRRIQNGPGPVDAPWQDGEQTENDTEVSIAFFPASMSDTARQSPVTQSYIKESTVPLTLYVGLMVGQSFKPSLKDVVIRDGAEMRIGAIDPLNPNGTDIIYQLQLLQ